MVFGFKKMNKGFSLIEVMVAVLVTIIGVVGIYALVPHIIKSTAFNYDRFIAIQLARDGIETVRNVRDGNWLQGGPNWNQGLTGCGTGCQIDYTILGVENPTPGLPGFISWAPGTGGIFLRIDSQGFYNYSNGDPTKFKRRIWFSPADGGKGLSVKVEVFWPDYSPTPENVLVLEEVLYNWH